MKVLMTADAVGGVWTYALELCRALAERNVEVVLATMGPSPSDTQCSRVHALPNVALHASTFRLEWMDEPWSDVERAGEWLRSLAASEKVDLIHLNGYAHAALDWEQPVLVAAHSCVYSWWRAVHGTHPPSSRDRYRCAVESGLARAAGVIAPTHAFMRELRRHYRFETPTHVIYNARTPHALVREGDAAKERFVMASGRVWDEAKNLRMLDVGARRVSWPIIVAGETRSPDGRSYDPQTIHCLGRQKEDAVARCMKRASIFVHPARYEPFGLAVLEAAQAACALVLSDLETLRELWSGAALFVDSSNPTAIEGALRRLIDAPEERARLGALARERASMFSAARMGEHYFELYRTSMHSPARERSVA